MSERLFFGFEEDGDTRIADLRGSILSVDWNTSPAGSVAHWPAEVRSTIRTALHAISPMAVLIGREGIVVCNEAAREMFGDAFDAAQGKSIFDILPIAERFYRKVIDESYSRRSSRFRDEPIKLLRNGAWETCWFNLGISPIVDESGVTVGTLLVGSETSDHMRTRRALNLAHQRMETALDAGGIVGVWDFDVASRKIMIDGSLAAQYGIVEADARDGVPIEFMFENIHAEDRVRVLAAVDEAVASGQAFRQRFRTITKTGQLLWYVASGRPVRDDSQRVTGFAGIVVDVTGETEAVSALEQSNLRFATLVEAIPQIVWSTDRDGNHDYFNRRWTDFTGIVQEDIKPETWMELVHPDDWGRVTETWQECLATGKPYDIDYRFRYRDGSYRWLWVVALPMRDEKGNILRWYGTSSDIEDAKQLEAQKELLTGELDHRIKNLFALVSGLVALSAREEPELAPLADTLRSRLNALHKAHEIIRVNDRRDGGSFTRLLRELLAPYLSDGKDTVQFEGQDWQVRQDAVTSVALVFHELATNAAKYGALSSDDGRIRITLQRDETWHVITWIELSDTMTPSRSGAQGFGSRLLESVVEKQFRGSLTRSHHGDTFVIEVRLPASLFQDSIA